MDSRNLKHTKMSFSFFNFGFINQLKIGKPKVILRTVVS